MNKGNYHLVFNAARGCIMAVAESAQRCGKSGGTSVAKGTATLQGAGCLLVRSLGKLGLGASLLTTALAQAQIVADPGAAANQRPTVLTTPNGAPLVNIQTPSAAGVSRNTYKQFDVNANGAVLNNSRTNVQTQLGGWVQGNPWLARGPARVILNEVNSTNPSQLKGYVEVAGQRAEVIIANPAGIHIDGAGFINASRATLTTGVPIVNGGSLEGYRVQSGTIRIDGAGLDARLTDYTGILARAIEANALVHANDLKLIMGQNTISSDQALVQARADNSAGGAHIYALDVTQLGGMYAGKITLIGTEAGLGVRHHGILSASSGNIQLSNNGWLTSTGRIEATQGNVNIQTSQQQTYSGSVTAATDIALHSGAENEQAALDNSGSIRAGLELNMRARAVTNKGQINAQRLDVAVTTLANSGDIWQSGSQALNVQTDNLNNSSGAAIGAVQGANSTAGATTNTNAAPSPSPVPSPSPTFPTSPAAAPAAVTLANGLISVSGTLSNQSQGTLAAAGDLHLRSRVSLTNAGNIQAQTVQALGERFENTAGTVNTPQLTVNVDKLAFGGGAVVANMANLTSVEYVQGQGAQLYTKGALTLNAQDVSNAGEIQSASTLQLEVQGALANTGTIAAESNLTIYAASVNSSGVLAAGLNADGTLKSFAADGAKLRVNTTGDLSASGKNLVAGVMTLEGSHVNVGNSQTMAHSADMTARESFSSNNGKIITQEDIVLHAKNLSNVGGVIYAGKDAVLSTRDAMRNTGTLAATHDLTLSAGSIDSSGSLIAGLNADGTLKTFAQDAAKLQMSSAGDISATGKNLAAGAMTLSGHHVSLKSSQSSAHTVTVVASGGLDSRQAKVFSQGELTLQAQGQLDNTAGTVVAKDGHLTVTASGINNTEGLMIAAAAIRADAQNANLNNNRGAILAQAQVQLVSSASVINTGGLIQSNTAVSVAAAAIDNSQTHGSAQGQATQGIVGQDVTLSTDSLNNTDGQVIAMRDLTVSVDSSISNTRGLLSAQRNLTLQSKTPSVSVPPAQRTLTIGNSGGAIVANSATHPSDSALSIKAKTLGLDGTVHSSGDMTLDLVGDHRTPNGQKIRAGRNLSLQLHGGQLDNAGQWQAGQDLSVHADHINNQATGELLSRGVTTLDTSQNSAGIVTNRGLVDGADTRISSQTVDNVGTGRIYGDRIAIAANTLTNKEEIVNGLTSAATIAARERLDIGVQHITNREGALIYSDGDMAIGGALDTRHQATTDGSANAQTLNNNSATLESAGSMALASHTLSNTNEHLSWNLVTQSQAQRVDYYTSQGYISSQDVGWTASGRSFVHAASVYGNPQYKTFYQGPQPFVEAHNQTVGSGDSESSVYVPDAFNYARNSTIWAALGMSPPAWDAPGPRPQQTCDDFGCTNITAALALWQENAEPWYELNRRFAAFTQTVNQQMLSYDIYRTYTETIQDLQVTRSQPGRIGVGGNLQLSLSGSALNQDSQIVVGAAITGQTAALTNRSTKTQAPTLRSGTVYDWGTVGEDCNFLGAKCEPEYGWRSNAYQENIARELTLPVLRYQQSTRPASGGFAISALTTTGALQTSGRANAQASANALNGQGANTSAVSGVGSGGASTSASQGATATTKLAGQTAPGLVLPGSSLFKIAPDSNASYVVETDPRFASYRNWLSSDYMLSALAIDPATTQKRLGDGFYEQKLIREQVAALTGYRYLGDYRSDEAQYQALMNAGTTFARAQQLRPGIALSAAQVAQLTSDMVWLVTQEVTLPDGSRTSALVPQVYLAPKTGDLAATGELFGGAAGTGSLITARDIQLTLSGDADNSGTIAGRRLLDISAQNITNTGLLQGEVALLTARQDIRIQGGNVAAATSMTVQADQDLSVTTTTARGEGTAGNGVFASEQLDRVAGLYVSGPAGVLLASAGRDLNLTAAQISNQGKGQIELAAGGSLHLSTVQTGSSIDVTHDAQNYARVQQSQDVGTQISGQGAVTLQAQTELNAKAANVNAGGALTLNATDGSVNIDTGQSSYGIQTGSHIKASGWLASTTVTQRSNSQSTTAVASNLEGQSVSISAGQDLRVKGSNVLADQGVNLNAVRNVRIEAAQNTQSQGGFNEVKESGLLSSGGIGFTIGSRKQSLDQTGKSTTAAQSTIGAINGNVTINAGGAFTQTGSDVITPKGDIAITAKKVDITEARETWSQSTEQKFKQSGLTLAITSPVLSALQTVQSQLQAAGNTSSGRMQLLAGANAAFNLKQGADAVTAGQGDANGMVKTGAQNPDGTPKTNADGTPETKQGNAADKAGGIGISISVGSSSSQSKQSSSADNARGSSINAGGNITIQATGAGKDSNLTVQGSSVQAAGTTRLQADKQVNLLAAQNTTTESSTNQSKSGSVGVAMQLGNGGGGMGFTASASKATGQGAGNGVTYTNTQVAGNTVQIESGGDTTLKGAVVKADQVTAQVGGNLTIQSLQDTNQYKESSKSAGGSIMVGAGVSGSVNLAKSSINSNYQSVGEQSAIRAGDGGFQVEVKGNTTLTGAQITSTQAAIDKNKDNNKNSFQTGGTLTTTDLQNQASYEAKSVSVGVGAGTLPGKSASAGMSGVGFGSDSGNAASTSTAGISGVAGNTAARTGDKSTGLTSIFNKDQVKQEVNAQVAITSEFGKQASKFGGTEADKQRDSLKQQAAQAQQNGDTTQAQALLADAAKWDEGGAYRVAMHAAIGGLTGGAAGAVGAGAGSAAAPAIEQLQGQLKTALKGAGLGDSAANVISSLAAGTTAAAVGAAASGGSTAGAATAFNADMNNRQLHPSEKQRIKDLAKGDAQKEARLTAAACALVSCYAEYPQGSATYNALKAMADAGSSDAMSAERQQLQAQQGLFGYSTQGVLSDKNIDAAKQLNNTYQITTRALGAGQAVLGGLGVAGSVATAPVSCATGVGCLANATVGTLSADAALSGAKQLVSGQPENTALNNTLQALGLSPEAAGYAEVALGIGAAAKVGSVVNATTATQAGNSTAARLSYEDISKFGAKGVNVTPEVMQTPQAKALIAEYQAAGLTASDAERYARGVLQTGQNLPITRTVAANEELIKVVPKSALADDGVTKVSPYFMTRAEYDSLNKLSPAEISQKLGLPAEQSIRGAQLGFEAYSITPKPGTSPTVFTSTVAPVEQGAYNAAGGAQQTVVPNRSLWTEPKSIGSVGGKK